MPGRSTHIESSAQSIGETLKKPFFYQVPAHQRDFSWKLEQIDELWDDFSRAMNQGHAEYFLGAAVLSQRPDDDKIKEIVDGQQRLAVLTMIFSAISNYWHDKEDTEREVGVFRDFIGAKDRRTGEVRPRISLNETNNPVFQKVVVKRETPEVAEYKAMADSNRRLCDAFARIQERLSEWLKEFSADIDSAVLDLEEFIENKVHLIVIETGSDSDAFSIFETLNDRGLLLAPADLIKNYLFSLAEGHLPRFKRDWSEIALLVGGDQLTPFLRHYWLSKYAFVRERDLDRDLRNEVRSPTKAREFMEQLRQAADMYAALSNPEHTYWVDLPDQARHHLEAILTFKVTQYKSLALAGMDGMDGSAAAGLFRVIMVVTFRYTMISGLGTGALESHYARAAKALRTGDVNSAKDVFDILSPAYPDDEKFKRDFSQKKFTRPRLARYVLTHINDKLGGDPETTVAPRITLEHIYPKKPSSEWTFAEGEREKMDVLCETIGNLTLLEQGRNRGIANATFATKKERAFKDSSLALNREIVRISEWDAHQISVRNEELARIASEIWRLDY